jgi:hypothetical protein
MQSNSVITNSVINEHSVITNRFESHIGHFNSQNNPVITNKNGRSLTVRYNRVWLFLPFFSKQCEMGGHRPNDRNARSRSFGFHWTGWFMHSRSIGSISLEFTNDSFCKLIQNKSKSTKRHRKTLAVIVCKYIKK